LLIAPGSGVVAVLDLGGWDVAELAVEASLVEPFDVGESGQLDVLGMPPGALPADELGPGEAVDRLDLGESFIVTRNGTPDGELTPLRRHRFVSTDTVVAMFRHAPAVDARRFREDLDAGVDQDATPRG
jgi:hypothetical protein